MESLVQHMARPKSATVAVRDVGFWNSGSERGTKAVFACCIPNRVIALLGVVE
jgi:hypothetical protein